MFILLWCQSAGLSSRRVRRDQQCLRVLVFCRYAGPHGHVQASYQFKSLSSANVGGWDTYLATSGEHTHAHTPAHTHTHKHTHTHTHLTSSGNGIQDTMDHGMCLHVSQTKANADSRAFALQRT